MGRSAALLALALSAAGCHAGSSGESAPEKRESPQASAQPALLAAGPTQSAMLPAMTIEGGPPPAPFRGDEVLPVDALPREGASFAVSAALRLADVTGPLRAPEVSAPGLEAARKATALTMNVEFSPSRLRVGLEGRGFVLPVGSTIHARADRFGHLVLWEGWYRPLAPGALRAMLGERRFDVAPITPASVTPREDGGRRLGLRSRTVEVETRAARAVFEIGKLEGAGEGGALLCRLLLDLMNAPPATPVCGVDEVPLRAELRWTSQGSLVFEATSPVRRVELDTSALLVPPPSVSFGAGPLPSGRVMALLDEGELAALRTADVDVAPPADVEDGELAVHNATIGLKVLFLDGVPVAWAGPGARGALRGLRRGRYLAQWRTFLGDVIDPPVTVTVPGLAAVGEAPDAGPEAR